MREVRTYECIEIAMSLHHVKTYEELISREFKSHDPLR